LIVQEILNQKVMVEKNYDPDNDNCPEKETVENLHKSKLSSDKNNTQTVEEFIDNSPNCISRDKNELQNIADSNDKKDKTKDLEDNKN
jgi:hypothetical protein